MKRWKRGLPNRVSHGNYHTWNIGGSKYLKY